jgi:hypothetical protein
MAIENLPTFSHVLAGGAGALIALSIASAVTRLRSRLAGSATAALEARLRVLEGEMPNKASVQALASISTRLTVHEVGVQPAGLDGGELAISTDADGRVLGVQLKAEADRRAQAVLQQAAERSAGATSEWSPAQFSIDAPDGPFLVVPRADGTTKLEINRPTGPLG